MGKRASIGFAFAFVATSRILFAAELQLQTQRCLEQYEEQILQTKERVASIQTLDCMSADELSDLDAMVSQLDFEMATFQDSLRIISHDYQRIQERLAYCRSNTIMSAPIKSRTLLQGSKDDQNRLFFQALGDVVGQAEGGFSGFQSEKTLVHRLDELSAIKDVLKGRVFIASEAQASPCKSMNLEALPKEEAPLPDFSPVLLAKLVHQSQQAERLQRVFMGDHSGLDSNVAKLGALGAFRAIFMEQIQDLGDGESLFLPAGWTKHAVNYQVTKEPGGQSFTLRIFNSGEGIEYHASSTTGYKSQVFPFASVAKISYERITSLVFLKALQEIASPLYRSTPADLYEKLLPIMGGTVEPIVASADLLRDPQNSGTCTYFSMPWVLSNSVAQFLDVSESQSQRVSDQIELFIGMRTLQGYANILSKEGANVDQTRLNLLRKGLSYFASKTAHVFDEGSIDRGTLACASDVQGEVVTQAKRCLAKLDEKLAKNAINFKADKANESHLPTVPAVLAGGPEIAKSPTNLGKTLSLVSAKGWQAPRDKIQLISDLKAFIKSFDEMRTDQLADRIIAVEIERLALALPLEKEFWQATTDSQATELISLVAMIEQHFVFSLLQQAANKSRDLGRATSIEYLIALKLQTICDLLNQDYVTSVNPKIPSLYYARIKDVLFGDTGAFEVFDKSWQWQVKLLRGYYREQSQEASFFGFDKLPAGAHWDPSGAWIIPPDGPLRFREFYDDDNSKELLPKEKLDFTSAIKWRDFEWAKQFIKKQPNYEKWLYDNLVANEKNYRFDFVCKTPTRPDLFPTPLNWPVVSRVAPPNIGTEIVLNIGAIHLLTDDQHRLGMAIPKTFGDLRKVAYLADYLLTGTLVAKTRIFNDGVKAVILNENTQTFSMSDGKPCESPLFGEGKSFKSGSINAYQLVYSVFGADWRSSRYSDYKTALNNMIFGTKAEPNTHEWYPDLGQAIKKTDYSYYYYPPFGGMASAAIALKSGKAHRDLLSVYAKNISFQGGEAEVDRKRYRPNALVLSTPAKEWLFNLNLENMRQLFGISGVKEQQVVQTFAYFNKYPALLTLPEYQGLFQKLVLEPSIILDAFRVSDANSTSLAQKMADFCATRFQRFQEFGDYKGMAFILRLNHILKDEVAYARSLPGARVPAGLEDAFFDSRQKVLDVLALIKSEQTAEKSLLYRTLAETFLYQDNMSGKDVEQLLFATMGHKTLGDVNPQFEDAHAERSIRNLLLVHAKDIRSHLMQKVISKGWFTTQETWQVSDEGAAILDQVLAQIRPDIKGRRTWEASTGKAGWFSFGNVYGAPAILSAATESGQRIQFDLVDAGAFESGGKQVHFPIPQTTMEEVFGKTTFGLLATELAADTYEWNQDGVLTRAKRQNTGWTFQQLVSQVINGEQISYWDTLKEDLGNANSKAFFPGFKHWQSLEPHRGDWLVRVLDPVTRRESYFSRVATEPKDAPVSVVTRLNDKALLREVPDNSAWRAFAGLEDWRYVYIWGDKDQANEVDLPRLDLTFRLQKQNSTGETALSCGPKEGYQVSTKQFSSVLGNPIHYVLCENDQHKQLALMSRTQFKMPKEANVFTAKYDRVENNHPLTTRIPYFTYDIDESTVDQPIRFASDEARYYLAYVRLWQQRYQDVADLIRGTSSVLRPLSNAEREILQWTLAGNETDNDPRAKAIRLLAFHKLVINHRFYPMSSAEPNFADAGKIYETYIQVAEHVSPTLLSPDEELAIEPMRLSSGRGAARQLALQQWIEGRNSVATPAVVANLKDNKLVDWNRYKGSGEYLLDTILTGEISPSLRGDFPYVCNGQSSALSPVGLSYKPKFSADKYEEVQSLFVKAFWWTKIDGDRLDAERALALIKTELVVKNLPPPKNDEEMKSQVMSLHSLLRHQAQNYFELLYRVVSGDAFDVELALALIKTALGVRDLPPLNKEETRSQLISLLNAGIKVDACQDFATLAHMLSALAKGHQGGAKLPRYDDLRTNEAREKAIPELLRIADANKMNSANQAPTTIESKPVELKTAKRPQVPSAPAESEFDASPLAFPKDPLGESIVSKSKLDLVISVSALSAVDREKITAAARSLNAKLDRARTAPPEIYRAVTDLENKIEIRAEKWASERQSYAVRDWKALDALRQEIANKAKEAKKQLVTDREQLLTLAHKEASKFEQGAYNRLISIAGFSRELKLDDLFYLLLKHKLSAFYEASSGALTIDAVKLLQNKIISYLMLSTYAEHAKRIENAIATLESKRETSDEEFQQLAANVVDAAAAVRNYDPSEHLEYLVFEHIMGILLRATQRDALDQLRLEKGHLKNEKALGGALEMIMGAGKTSVLLPLLSTLDAQGDSINIIMLPEALATSMSQMLSSQLYSAFGRSVDVLLFSRECRLAGPDLRVLEERLLRAQKEHRTIITTNGAIQSLFLSYLDRLSRYKKEPQLVADEIDAFNNIFRFFREHGRLTIDEVDLALDVLLAHQFSVGHPDSLQRSAVLATIPAVAESFYHFLASGPKSIATIKIPFLPNSRGASAFTATAYSELKPRLIDDLLAETMFFFADKSRNQIFRDYLSTPHARVLAASYLKNGSAADRNALFASIDEKNNADNADKLKDVFAVLYDELNAIFPLTALRKLDVHYGPMLLASRKENECHENRQSDSLSFENTKFIAIPYHSGEPMTRSRFGTPLEAVNYTLQMTLERQDYRELVEKELESLKELAAKGMNPARLRIINKRLAKLAGDNTSLSIVHYRASDIIAIAKSVADHRIGAQFDLIHHYVLPQVTAYETQLQTSAQIYSELFQVVQGFSGTLWSADTFPKIFRNPILSNTTERTLLTLWYDDLARKSSGHGNSVKMLSSSEGNLGSLLSQLYTGWQQPGSLLDEAGVLRAYDNEKVARAIMNTGALEKSFQSPAVVFYDAQDNLKNLESNATVTHSNAANALLKNGVAFWDKKHTTGSDIKLVPTMQAKMTFDHHITSRAFQQTVWRLRGLGQGQSVVEYWVRANDLDIIETRMRKEWGIVSEGPFDLGDLILYSVVNQEARLGELRFRALKQKIRNIVISRLMTKMFDASTSREKCVRLYEDFNRLFETSTGKVALYNSYGLPKAFEDVDVALNKEVAKLLDPSLVQAISQTLGAGVDELRKEIQKLISEEKPSLPQQIYAAEFESESEVEIEAEQQQEQEKESELEKEEETESEMNSGVQEYEPHAELKWLLNDQSFSRAAFEPIPMSSLNDVTQEGLKNHQPIVSLNEALSYRRLDVLAKQTNRALYVSLNFAPIYYRSDMGRSPEFQFFDRFNKELTDVLVIQDRNSGAHRLILLDGNDVQQWNAFLAQDARSDSHSSELRDVRIAIYSMSSGIWTHGADPVDEHTAKSDPHFVELLAQAKFFGGFVDYSDSEVPFLRAFIVGTSTDSEVSRAHAKEMLRIFRTDILKFKAQSKKDFRDSDIYRVFEDVLGHIE